MLCVVKIYENGKIYILNKYIEQNKNKLYFIWYLSQDFFFVNGTGNNSQKK